MKQKKYVVMDRLTGRYLNNKDRDKTFNTANLNNARLYRGIAGAKMSWGNLNCVEYNSRAACWHCGGTGFEGIATKQKFVFPEHLEIIEVDVTNEVSKTEN